MNIILAQITYDQLLDKLKHDLTTSGPLWPPDLGHWPHLVLTGILVLFVIMFLIMTWFTVKTQQVGIVERFGRFKRLAPAGLNFKLPIIERVVDKLSLMQEQHGVTFGSITKDKVTVKVWATIQYKVIPGREYDAYYLLDDPSEQIERFFFDIMRSQVPVLTLDALYEAKESVSDSATVELEKDMTPFGYDVQRVLITAIEPDEKVKAAMNDINAAEREAKAAVSRGEAAKIQQVKAAEAQAEADKLRGTGIANQRIEIAKGFQKSVEEMRAAVPNTSDADILTLLTMVQYFEMMEKIGAHGCNTVMIPHSPGGIADIRSQVLQAITAGQQNSSEK